MLYKLISVDNDDMTRIMKLQNLITNTVEECFDDSALISTENFNFMVIGRSYECKIKLFGRPIIQKTRESNTFKIIDTNSIIGQKSMAKVINNGNEYYIPKQKIMSYINKDIIEFLATRKDLIQVDNIIHGDLL